MEEAHSPWKLPVLEPLVYVDTAPSIRFFAHFCLEPFRPGGLCWSVFTEACVQFVRAVLDVECEWKLEDFFAVVYCRQKFVMTDVAVRANLMNSGEWLARVG